MALAMAPETMRRLVQQGLRQTDFMYANMGHQSMHHGSAASIITTAMHFIDAVQGLPRLCPTAALGPHTFLVSHPPQHFHRSAGTGEWDGGRTPVSKQCYCEALRLGEQPAAQHA